MCTLFVLSHSRDQSQVTVEHWGVWLSKKNIRFFLFTRSWVLSGRAWRRVDRRGTAVPSHVPRPNHAGRKKWSFFFLRASLLNAQRSPGFGHKKGIIPKTVGLHTIFYRSYIGCWYLKFGIIRFSWPKLGDRWALRGRAPKKKIFVFFYLRDWGGGWPWDCRCESSKTPTLQFHSELSAEWMSSEPSQWTGEGLQSRGCPPPQSCRQKKTKFFFSEPAPSTLNSHLVLVTRNGLYLCSLPNQQISITSNAPCSNSKGNCTSEVEGIDDASVIRRHLSIGITAETVIKPIVTNSLNSVHTKK